jgi:pyruvate formate lyase activating enzyme
MPASATDPQSDGQSDAQFDAREGAERLRIGGLTPLTTVDYPGELAAVVFCQGCPWRCRYCQNGDLLPANRADLVRWSRVRDLLERRHGLLDAVVFSGGEPMLQAALPAAMAEVKARGFKVGLHTAGIYPQRLRLVLPDLDWVGLDIKALPEDYPAVTGIPRSGTGPWESLGLLLDAGVALEVRTTPMPGLDSAAYLDRLMQRLAAAGVRDYVLQRCHTEHSLDRRLHAQIPAAPTVWSPAPLPVRRRTA